MFDDCLLEKLKQLFALEAACQENWEEWKDWQKATDVKIIETALKRCAEYLKKEIDATYYI